MGKRKRDETDRQITDKQTNHNYDIAKERVRKMDRKQLQHKVFKKENKD